MGEILDDGLYEKNKEKKEAAHRKQQNIINRQKQKTALEYAEEQDDLARKKALALSPRKGRRSLINPSGLKTTLG